MICRKKNKDKQQGGSNDPPCCFALMNVSTQKNADK